jgi:hydrogenase nickel incorporation protein HypB
MCNDCGCHLKATQPTTGGDSSTPAGATPAPRFQVSGTTSQRTPRRPAAHAPEDRQHVDLLQHLLRENDRQATHNRRHLDRHGLLAVNLMSSPGAGKTTLLEATVEALGAAVRIGVIEGDLATDRDAQRLRAKGVPAVQITTGSACHLDAHMVHDALHQLPLDRLDLLFIENVGNLVCPAGFDLGEHRRVALLATTEGDDKPAKYPVLFRLVDLVLITKQDLLPHLDDFDVQRATDAVRDLANAAPVLTLSARTGQDIAPWLAWLRQALEVQRQQAPSADPATRP